ncbi:FAD dependent oxidoreductase [Hymenopellis radicata]|nr:FAD dependent oxidoreductase [Hymenopellis radicata]
MDPEDGARNVVIIGAGIIGCSTAYYLTRHPAFSSATSIRILEASVHGPAQGASGKAGGLIAKWAYPKELVDLSFSEHVRLAEEHNGTDRWGWRYVNCGSWEGKGEPSTTESGSEVGCGGRRKSLEKTLGLDPAAESSRARQSKGLPDDLLWVKEHVTESYSPMAPPGATAQVHPYLFTTSMLDLAREMGAELISAAKAVSISQSGGRVTGVTYQDLASNRTLEIPATHVVVAAGAWSPSIIPRLPISATRAHSLTIQAAPGTTIAPYVLFTEIMLQEGGRRKRVSPEIYARPGNEVYACGPGDDSPIPETVRWRSAHYKYFHRAKLGHCKCPTACFLPIVSAGGGPIVGPAENLAHGLYIAAGHTCWGICNAPGTAKVLTEHIMDGRIRSANLKKLDPSRFT